MVQLKCNVACARKKLERSTRVLPLQHSSVLNSTRESLGFNTRVLNPWILASLVILQDIFVREKQRIVPFLLEILSMAISKWAYPLATG